MTFWVAGAAVGGAALGAWSANKSANAQADAANTSAALQNSQWQQTRQDQMPWMQAGQNALTKLQGMSYTPFTQATMQQDPGYQFRLSEGLKSLDRQAAANGGLISGNALKASQTYGQNMASQEYQNAFNRYQTEWQNKLNPLQSMAGLGQTTAAQLGNTGMTAMTNVGNNLQGAANARASGYVGATNSLNNAMGQYLNYSQNQQYLNSLNQPAYGATQTFGPSLNGMVLP